MQQKLTFTGGMNSDAADELIPPNERRFALNCRILSSDTGQVGALETVNGSTLVPFVLPAGNNTVIGSFEYELTKKNYYFVHNTLANHSILEYDQVLNTIGKVFQSSILNFKLSALITGINVISLDADNHLLYWTDGWINPLNPNDFNEPKKINIEKGKAFMQANYVVGYKFPFDPSILYRIKTPPLFPPTYTWSGLNDAYLFKISNSSSNIFSVIGGQPAIGLRFDTPYFDPGAEYNPANGAWIVQTAKTYSVAGQIKIFNTNASSIIGIFGFVSLSVNGVVVAEAQSPLLHDGSITTIQVNKTLALNVGDVVRITTHGQNSGSFDVLPVSFLVTEPSVSTEDINHFFKKLFQFKVQFGYDDKELSAWSPISNYVFPQTIGSEPTGEDVSAQDNKITIQVPTGSSIVTKIRISAKEVGIANFSLIAELDKAELQIADNTFYNYEFTNTINAVPLEVTESIKLFDTVPLTSKAQELIKGIRLVDGDITENFDPVSIDMRLGIDYVQTAVNNSNTFFPAVQHPKSGSLSEYGIVYYDHANRSGLANVIKGKSTVILQNGTYGTSLYIPFLTEDTYNPAFPNGRMDYVPLVKGEIYNEPPEWATHYQIVRSRNQTMGRFIQFTAQEVTYLDVDGNTTTNRAIAYTIVLSIANIIGRYKTENPNSTLVYDYVKGDRIRFIAAPASTSPAFTSIGPFLPFNDSEIDSFTPATQTLTLKINNNIILRNTDINPGVLFEIYTPVAEVIEGEALVYETGHCYNISVNSLGQRIHEGPQGNQLRYDFVNDIFQAGSVGFIGVGISGLAVGDKIKAASPVYNPNNTYGAVTAVTPAGAFEIISTDIPWTASSVTNSGTLTKAALIDITGGDCFRRYTNMPWVTPSVFRLYSYTETMSASNMFTSNAYFFGRPNAIDPNIKRINRPTTITYSNIFVPETFINGLSSTSSNNFQTYDIPFGGIQKLAYKNSNAENPTLSVFQQLKIGNVGIEQQNFTNVQGEDVVAISPEVLNTQIQYYAANYGIGQHPESFAQNQNASYGIDVKRGAAWRKSNDGLTPISEYSQHIYFTGLCKKIMLSSSKVKIYGVFDIRFNEYIIAVEAFSYVDNGVSIDVPTQTIAFNEKTNLWSTHYAYAPENMVSNGVNIISFKAGQLYKHNENALQNNFYGVQYKSEVWVVCNASPYEVKVLEAMEQVTNSPWEVYEITTPDGQKSNLLEEDFTEKENLQYGAFWMDENTPNVVNPLIEGDTMRDRTFLLKLRYNSNVYNKLFGININSIISSRHDDDGAKNSGPTYVKMV